MFKMGFKSLLTTTHAHRVLATALLTLLLAAVGTTAQAQRVGLKTNLLYWATATPNVGLEFRLNRHLTLDLDAAYNRLKVGDINSRGVYGEVSNSVVQRRGKGNQNITSLTAAYMLDAKAAVTGLPTANDVFQTTAIVGPTIGISSRKDHDTKVVMGIHAALQAGWRVTDNLELYVEPSATVYSKKIEPYTPHPAEGELKLSVGAKVHF